MTRPATHPSLDRLMAAQVLPRVAFGCVDARRATALMGRLFAAPHADYGTEYPRIFREFLGHFLDNDPSIRSRMISIGAAIIQVR